METMSASLIESLIAEHSSSAKTIDKLFVDYFASPIFSPSSVYSESSGFEIFVGSCFDAHSHQDLRLLGITAILNCAGNQSPPNHRLQREPGFRVATLPLEDHPKFPLLPFLPEAFAFLEDCRKEHRKVLVHCMQGKNRSVAVAVAFMVKHCGFSLQDAVVVCAMKRENVLANKGFIRQLVTFSS